MTTYEVNYEEVHQWLLEYKNTGNERTKKQLQNFIVIACLPMVKKIALGLARRSTDPVEDIVQVGSVGLIKAVSLFKPELSTSFKSYATYLITGEIKHYIRDKVSMIKPSREIQELAYRINLLTKKLSDDLGEDPTDEQLAAEMELSVQKIHEVIEGDRRKRTVSLDQIVNENDESAMTLSDRLADESYQNHLNLREDKIMLMDAITELDPLHREIIEMTFYQDMTQKAIGDKLNISQIQVSRHLKKALNNLFQIITNKQVNSEVD